MDTDSAPRKFSTSKLYLAIIDHYSAPPSRSRSTSSIPLTANIAPAASAALQRRLAEELDCAAGNGFPPLIDLELVEMHAHEASTGDILAGLGELHLKAATLMEMLEILAVHKHLLECTPPYPCLAGLSVSTPGQPVPILLEDRPQPLLDLVSNLADPWDGHYMIFAARL